MENMSDIKGIIFDYGGTLDSRGEHWSEVIWRGYCNSNANVEYKAFIDAYVYAERCLAKEIRVPKEYNFLELIKLKVGIQLDFLIENNSFLGNKDSVLNEVSQYCYQSAKKCIDEAISVLDILRPKFKLGIVSNFYGNLRSVLADFGVLVYFDFVIESAEVGVRKPDSKIFKIGVKSMKLSSAEVLVVGDSYSKDVEPAMSIGCRAVWLKGKGWGEEPINDLNVKTIANLRDLLDISLNDF